jgi:hypothetical protein
LCQGNEHCEHDLPKKYGAPRVYLFNFYYL